MLASLSDLGYTVEWRVANAAEYGYPQKRRRVFIVAEMISRGHVSDLAEETILRSGVLAEALPVSERFDGKPDSRSFSIDGDLLEITQQFGLGNKVSPFANSGLIRDRLVTTIRTTPDYVGAKQVLKDVLEPNGDVPDSYLVPAESLHRWRYAKGAKSEERKQKQSGFTYRYTEGALPFPDPVDRPARTVLTSEIGTSPSRMRHIVSAGNGDYRRLTPVELERLNGFPDNWTEHPGVTDSKRGFLMGNALVVGLIERIGSALIERVPSDPEVPARTPSS
jgi:DNA (cytosine-5)-methyltransferase 1